MASKFVGLQNFTDIFTGANPVTGSYGTMDRFWNAFLNTTFITIVCVILETVIGVAMALIMAKAFRGRGIVRAGILVPWAIPTIVSALMWKLIFDSSGVMNRILGSRDSLARRYRGLVLGDRHRGYLEDRSVHRAADPRRAANHSGGGAMRQPRSTGQPPGSSSSESHLPMVKPALVVAVLFRTLDTLRMFDLPYGMIGPGKYRVETLSVFAYQEAAQTRYGPAAAYAIILFIYVLLVAFLFVRILGAEVIGDADGKQKKKKKGDNEPGPPATALEMAGGAH